MKRVIEFLNPDKTRARITEYPGWLARTFGKVPRSAEVQYDERAAYDWVFCGDGGNVHFDISIELQEARRWQDTSPIPEARLLTKDRP
jgi:hypothetical protein